ncbi:MAG TPA: hypothetical protein VHB98_05290, partial [Chloroflexota bacterium]|nr:hypothetical protein [Chloroflexota bacterium]
MWIRGVAPSSAPAAVPLDSPSASWSRGPTSISPTIKVENGHLPLLAVDAMLVICRIRDMASEELLAQKGSPARSWPVVVSLDRGAEQETGPQQDSREGDHTMARKTIGAWIHQALGGHKTGAATAGIGNQVLTNEGTVLGTITAVWKGADATDHASHEDTLCV